MKGFVKENRKEEGLEENRTTYKKNERKEGGKKGTRETHTHRERERERERVSEREREKENEDTR